VKYGEWHQNGRLVVGICGGGRPEREAMEVRGAGISGDVRRERKMWIGKKREARRNASRGSDEDAGCRV